MKIMMRARLMCFVLDVSGFQNETEDGSPPSGFVAAFSCGNAPVPVAEGKGAPFASPGAFPAVVGRLQVRSA